MASKSSGCGARTAMRCLCGQSCLLSSSSAMRAALYSMGRGSSTDMRYWKLISPPGGRRSRKRESIGVAKAGTGSSPSLSSQAKTTCGAPSMKARSRVYMPSISPERATRQRTELISMGVPFGECEGNACRENDGRRVDSTRLPSGHLADGLAEADQSEGEEGAAAGNDAQHLRPDD